MIVELALGVDFSKMMVEENSLKTWCSDLPKQLSPPSGLPKSPLACTSVKTEARYQQSSNTCSDTLLACN